MYEIEFCGGQGLAAALASAAETVREMGEEAVIHVAVLPDKNVADCYWVHVVYMPQRAQGPLYRP